MINRKDAKNTKGSGNFVMTVREVSESFQVGLRPVQKWIKRGYLPAFKLPDELARWYGFEIK